MVHFLQSLLCTTCSCFTTQRWEQKVLVKRCLSGWWAHAMFRFSSAAKVDRTKVTSDDEDFVCLFHQIKSFHQRNLPDASIVVIIGSVCDGEQWSETTRGGFWLENCAKCFATREVSRRRWWFRMDQNTFHNRRFRRWFMSRCDNKIICLNWTKS